MMTLKNKRWIGLGVTLVFSLLIWLAGWLSSLWTLGTGLAITLSIVASIMPAALLALLIVFLLARPKKEKPVVTEEAQRQRQFMKLQTARHFDKVWALKKSNQPSQYDSPWYLLVSDNEEEDTALLRHQGFEQVYEEAANVDVTRLPVTFWVNESAVVAAVHSQYPYDDIEPALSTLIAKLNRTRARQAANGVIVTSRLHTIVNQDSARLLQQVKRPRDIIREINTGFGLSLPIYVWLTQMSGIENLCESFSTLAEHELELPFGDLAPIKKNDGYHRDWFEASYSELTQHIAGQLLTGLRAQIRSNFRDAILAGAFQFESLKHPIAEYLDSLLAESQFETQPMTFRGYFFVNAGLPADKTNPLALAHAVELGYESIQLASQTDRARHLFIKQLWRKVILPEARLVGVNQSRNTRYQAGKYALSLGLLLTFGGFLGLIKANFDYYQALDQQALVQLDAYKDTMTENKPTLDDIASSIYSLSQLREVRDIYQQPSPWYIQNWLPDPSIRNAVNAAYQQQLEQILLVSMRDTLLKDLFVFNELADKVKSLELFNLQQVLADTERENSDLLVNYFVEVLKEEGEGDINTLARFEELAYDVLDTGAVPPQDSQTLIAVVESTLSTNDLTDLLYQHVVQSSHYARRVDVRDQLGQDYSRLYRFSDDFGGYLIPYIYTREGFTELMETTAFNLANEFIERYEGIMGQVSGRAELNRLNRQLRKRYVEHYVAHWQSIMTHIELVEANTWPDVELQLSTSVDPVFSPLLKLYNLLYQETNLADVLEAQQADESAKEKALNAVAGVNPLVQQRDIIASVIQSIAQPFIGYHTLVTVDESGQNRLDLVRTQMAATQAWIKQANAGNRQAFMLDALKKSDMANPIALQYDMANRFNDPLIPDLLRSNAQQLNRLVIADVIGLLARQWRGMTQFYDQRMANRYPFKADAQRDVSLHDFTELFGPEGLIADFETDYLSSFDRTRPGPPIIQGLLAGQTLTLSTRFWRFIDSVKTARSILFVNGELGFNFSIKAQSLSSELIEVSLRSDNALFDYRNGPSFWTAQQWPTPINESQTLYFVLKDNNNVTQRFTYDSRWNWFRLVDDMSGELTDDNNVSSAVMNADIGQATLLLQTEAERNPLIRGYFNRLEVPASL